MKNRMLVAAALLLAGALFLAACGSRATSTPTAVPAPTVAPPTEVATAETALPVGGVEVAWEHVIQPEAAILARVNGVEIGKDTYLAELKQQIQQVTTQYSLDWNDTDNQSLLAGFQDSILQQMVEEELARQLATAEGISVTPDEVQIERTTAISSVLSSGQYASWDDFLTAMGYDETSLQKQIDTYLLYQKLLVAHGGSTTAEQVHAAHILVSSEVTATMILDELKAGASFADLAIKYSEDTGSASAGGDLGWFPRGMMVTEFEDAAFALNAGETSGLVKTDYGYHIITVLGKEMRELDEETLAQVREEAFNVWFEGQLGTANVETLVHFAPEES